MAYKQLKLWFDKELAILLANKLIQVDKTFKKAIFIKEVSAKVDPLELKDRVELIADALNQALSGNYSKKLKQLSKINQGMTFIYIAFKNIMDRLARCLVAQSSKYTT